jgi:hypothetical protein
MTTCQELAGFTENPWLSIAMSQAETQFTAIQQFQASTVTDDILRTKADALLRRHIHLVTRLICASSAVTQQAMPIFPAYHEFCPSNVRHNRADIGKA